MAAPKSPAFDELTKLATEFVTRHKGLWDHQAWMDFLSSLQSKGFDISEEMQSNLGLLLEAMKQFYSAAASTESVENAMRSVVDDSVAFVKHHKGVWGHSEWEDFIKTVHRNSLTLSEGTASYLGGILESMKVFYRISPVPVARRSAPYEALPSSSPSEPDNPAPHQGSETGGSVAPGPQPAPQASPAKAPETTVTQEPQRAREESAPAPRGPEKKAAPQAPGAKAEPAPSPQAPGKGAETGSEGAAAKKATSPKGPQNRDDLTVIGGIGPALEKKLNGAGIFSYSQLAALSDEDVAHLEKNIIRLSGRIKRDDWVGQAKKLT